MQTDHLPSCPKRHKAGQTRFWLTIQQTFLDDSLSFSFAKFSARSVALSVFGSLFISKFLKPTAPSSKTIRYFRHMQIIQFLKRMLPNRLPEFALEYRERGHPILAQVMEKLADELPPR
jgi:hypothetical protein